MAVGIKIEVLRHVDKDLTVVFNYDVPPGIQLLGAVDQAREAMGQHLTAAEIQDVKDGKIYQTVQTYKIEGMTPAQIGALLETSYTNGQSSAAAAYQNTYKNVGIRWNGTSWILP